MDYINGIILELGNFFKTPSVVAGMVSFGAMHYGFKAYTQYPLLYDENSIKQILKSNGVKLDTYFEKKEEYNQMKSDLFEMSEGRPCKDRNSVYDGNISLLLFKLKESPFYDNETCRPMYHNLWKSLQQNRHGADVYVSNLMPAPCTKGKNPKTEDTCTRRELFDDLITALNKVET